MKTTPSLAEAVAGKSDIPSRAAKWVADHLPRGVLMWAFVRSMELTGRRSPNTLRALGQSIYRRAKQIEEAEAGLERFAEASRASGGSLVN